MNAQIWQAIGNAALTVTCVWLRISVIELEKRVKRLEKEEG